MTATLREPSEAASHRIAASALENLREGVQVIGPDFRYLYVNDAVVAQARSSRDQLLGRKMEDAFPGIENTPLFVAIRQCMDDRVPSQLVNEFAYPDGAVGYFELKLEPVPDGVVILSVDVTAAKRADEALRRKSRALAMLSECNQALVRATDKGKFLQAICDLVVDHGGYRMAWIGLKRGAAAHTIEPVARAGHDDGYIDAGLKLSPTVRDAGPLAQVLKSGVPQAVRCIASDERTTPWRAAALARGYGSAVVVPLKDEGTVVGILSIFAAQADAFDDEELGVLAELGMDLGFGVQTLRARAERALLEARMHENEALLSAFFESPGAMRAVIELDGDVPIPVMLNQQTAALVQVDPGHLPQDGRELAMPEEAAPTLAAARECVDTGMPVSFEIQVGAHRGGGWYLNTVSPLGVGPNGLPRVAVVMNEITTQKRAQQAQRESDERLRVVLGLAEVVVWAAAPDGSRVLDVTSSFERVYGRSVEEFRARPELWREVVHPGDRAIAEQSNRDLFAHGHAKVEYRIVRPDGAVRWLIDEKAVVKDEHGAIVQIGGAALDITERKTAELELSRINVELDERVRSRTSALEDATEAAKQAALAKGAFLANMSHEIRTPMNAVLGFAQLLLRDPTTTSSQRSHLETITRAGDHLLSLIDGILQVARIEAGRVTLEERTFNLRDLLEELEHLFRQRAAAKGLRLLFELRDEVPRLVKGDEGKLRQVLSNLIGNALKFTDAGGVAVRFLSRGAPERRQLVVEVEDSGCGIAPADLPRLFQKFEQTEAGRASHQGTGLGLAISRELVRLMGGELGVESRLGEGSVFRFEVPLLEGREEELARRTLTGRVQRLAPGQPAHRVLVVDDKEDNRAFACGLLGAVGFECTHAEDGEDALRKLLAFQPHLVLMDMRMPVMDGAEAIRRIRATPEGATIKIISVTASAFEEDRQHAHSAGADDFLSKPFREEVLFEKIRALLGVEYLYELAPSTAEATSPCAVPSLPPDAALGLPSPLRERLVQATLRADFDAMLQLIEEARDHDARLAEVLRGLAERFSYQQLLDVLQAKGAGAGDRGASTEGKQGNEGIAS